MTLNKLCRPLLQVRVVAMRRESDLVTSFELAPVSGLKLPNYTPGAHIDVHLPNGLIRAYSLCGPVEDLSMYVIAVGATPSSKGGSVYLTSEVRVGHVLTIGAPRNNFILDEDAAHSVFFAGGIGITPIICMIRRLNSLGRRSTLHYGARSRQAAAFVKELERIRSHQENTVHFTFDDESVAGPLDFKRLISSSPPDSHFYCCGPLSMLRAFEVATLGVSPARVHLEHFSADQAPATDGGFTLNLSRSKRSVRVHPGQSILDSILSLGIDVPSACREGVCGSCETTVLAGEPDHRDLVLTKLERASNRTMMICCSGCKSSELTLDI